MDLFINNISAQVLVSVQSAILITNARGPDREIVYMNAAFETLTGYTEKQVLGRDCRFLQNDDNDQDDLKEIRNGLLEQRPVHGILRNYRKDGSRFFNEIFINPIMNDSGEVTHFVGCQNAVPDPGAAPLQKKVSDLIQNLTPREKQVFDLVIWGYSNKEIARFLELSPRTAEKHRLRMQKKMETQNQTLLTRYAIALGYGFNKIDLNDNS